MRNLLALLSAALLVFAGVGWYLGWYNLKTARDTEGHRQINIDVNAPKISHDLNKGKEKVGHLLTKEKDPKAEPQHIVPKDPEPQPPSGAPVLFRPNEDGTFTYSGTSGVVSPGNGPPPLPPQD